MGVGRELTQGTGITTDSVPQDEAVLQDEALARIAKKDNGWNRSLQTGSL
jgi:hypothetical protein